MIALRLDLSGPRARLDLAALPLTEAQRSALAFDRELIVTAGAGAGKTHTLSFRYVALLLELAGAAVQAAPRAPRPDIEAVLVLTFTEKAAQEMGARCYRRLLSLAELVRDPVQAAALDARYGAGHGAALAAALDHCVDTYERARIGTFHSFCARVLQEFPAEAGTPPDFAVLDEIDTRELYGRIVDSVLAEAYERSPERVSRFVAAVGSHAQARDGLLHCLRKRDVLGGILRQHGDGAFRVRDLLALFPRSPAWALRWLETEGRPLLEEICEAVALCGGGTFVNKTVRPVLARVESLLDQAEPDAFDVFAMLRELLESVTTKARGPRSLAHYTVLGKKDDWQIIGEQHRLDARERLEALQDWVREWGDLADEARGLPTRADQEMLGALEALGELFARATKALRDHFERERVLDFTGLQDRAVRAVLSHAGLQRRLADRHRWLMVDEFQDTDAQQWALIRALGRPDGAPCDRIFVVGDVKQAIYRFRGGDVTVFQQAARELGVEPLVLPENFRSRPELIGWFNHFFGRLLGPASAERPAHEAPYDSLAVGRPLPGGTVTLAVHDPESADADSALEAEGVARLLASTVLPGRGDFAGLDLLDRTVHPTPPVAILFRTRKRLAVFEAALRRHGVPTIVAKGVGFWSRPETRDVVNLLHAVATGDPVSTAGALRSPLLGLSDQDLQDIVDQRWGGPGSSDAIARLGEWALDDFTLPRVKRAAALLDRWRHLRHRLSVVDLLRRMLTDTRADHALALGDEAGQAAANVARLLELADRFDGRGPLGVDEAAAHFLAQVEAEPAETEAPVTPTAARVVLLTVHAAKGLEFPVVVVPECAGRPPHITASVVHGRIDGEWHVACRALDPTLDVRTRVRTGLVGLLSRIDAAEQAAESRRLLYVAATRARDHLLLVGARPKPLREGRDPTTWAEMLATVHGVEDAHGQRLLTEDAPGPRSGLEPGDHDGLRIVELDRWLERDPVLAVPDLPAPEPSPATPRDLAAIADAPVLEVTPSSLDRFARDPRTWYRQDRLGVADEAPSPARTERTLASVRGDVIHTVLEDDVADEPDVAIARWRALAASQGVDPAQVEAGIPAVLEHLARAAADPRVTHRLEAQGLAEVRFRLPHGGVVLVGQIDRLWRDDAAGGWVVLDWKSERVHGDPIDAARRHARQLLAYAWAADKVLRAHGEPGVVRAEVYFTHNAALVELGPLGPSELAQVGAELSRVAEVAALGWTEVAAGVAPIAAEGAVDVPLRLAGGGPEVAGDLPGWDTPVWQEARKPEPAATDERQWAEEPPSIADEPAWVAEPPSIADEPAWADEPPSVADEPAWLHEPAPADEPAPTDDTATEDPWAALRALLGAGPASTGTTPVPPEPRVAEPPAPPEPPPPDEAAAAVLESTTSYATLEQLVAEGFADPLVTPPPVRAAPPVPDSTLADSTLADAAIPPSAEPTAPLESGQPDDITAEEPPPPDIQQAPDWVDAAPPTEEEPAWEAPETTTPPPPPSRPPPRRSRRSAKVPEGQLSLFPPSTPS